MDATARSGSAPFDEDLDQRIESLLDRAWRSEGKERGTLAREVVRGVAASGATGDRARAYGAIGRAIAADLEGDLEAAFGLGQEALGILTRPGDALWQARLLGHLAVNASRRGLLSEAEALYERGLSVAREHGLSALEPSLVANLGILHAAGGDSALGLELLLEARRLFRRQGDARGEGMALVNAGPVYRVLGAYPDAVDALTEGMELLEATGPVTARADGLTNLAVVYCLLDNPDEALRCATEARDLAPSGSPTAVAAWDALAFAHGRAGNHEAALHAATRCLEKARSLGQDALVAAALLRLADTERDADRLDRAEARYREGLSVIEGMEFLGLEIGCKLGLAHLLATRGETDAAWELAESLVEPWEEFGERQTLLTLHELLAELAEARGLSQAALGHWKRACTLRKELYDHATDVRVRNLQSAQELRREQERSATVLRQLSRSVMDSTEKESRRLARDLHDDLGQRLAVLAVDLDMLEQEAPGLPAQVVERVEALSDRTRSIAESVHRISHRLHPATLMHLGFVEATRAVCEEMAAAHGIEIECLVDGVPPNVPDDVALGLYRIVQEALRNAVRHGQAPRAVVILRAEEGEIRLQVRDEGRGFEPASVETAGIGLVGMRERIQHLGGKFTLNSRPGRGTRIEVSVPLVMEDEGRQPETEALSTRSSFAPRRSAPRPRVLIADDHEMLAEAFERLLAAEFDVVGRVADGFELLEVAPRLRPDLVVLDVSMPRMNGLDAARRLKELLPDVRLVVVTMHEEPRIAAEALKAGASGFVFKSAVTNELREAVTTVADGGSYLTPLVDRAQVEKLLAPPTGKRAGSRLTPRQREVLQLLAEGLAMKQVARALGLAKRTVAHHKYKIMAEQGIDSNAGLVQLAIEECLIPASGSSPATQADPVDADPG